MATAEHKIKNILFYLIPSFIGNALPFITLPIITRFLSPQDFGISALAMSTTLIIANILVCNVDTAAYRYYFEYRKNTKEVAGLINTSLAYILLVGVVSIPIVYFASNAISRLIIGSAEYAQALFISYISACLSVLVNFYLMFYRNMEKAKDFSYLKTIQTLIGTILTLVLIIKFRMGYMGLIYATFGSFLIAFLVVSARFMIDFPFHFRAKMLIDNLKYGIPLLPNMFSGSIYQFFDKYMLQRIVSLSSTGIFSIAQNISTRLFTFMTAVQSTFEPIFMKDMFDRGAEGARSVGRNFTVFTYISLSVILGTILFGEEIIYILAPSSYYGAINVFMILLGAISMQTFGKIVGPQLAYPKKAYLSFPISLAGLAVNISLNLFLIPKWGASGAAFATFVTIALSNAISVFIAQKFYKIEYEKFFLLLIYSNVFISTFLLIYMRLIDAPILLKYGLKIASLAAYAYAGVRARIITKGNIRIVMNILRLRTSTEKYVEI
ncbi:MAG: oligosaccharide flippase family protein [Candidatus Omnitrophica bacterium]|nr:oligosaccharide flippase family protein [Candidatus Omnitrophota bacterium]